MLTLFQLLYAAKMVPYRYKLTITKQQVYYKILHKVILAKAFYVKEKNW